MDISKAIQFAKFAQKQESAYPEVKKFYKRAETALEEMQENAEKRKYLIFVEAEGIYNERQGETSAYLRYDCPPLDTLEEAQRTIREICINSEYKIQDFSVFVEYPTGEGGDNGTKKHDNR